MTNGSHTMARPMPMTKPNVNSAMLNAPKSAPPTLRATTSARTAFVRLETAWSTSVHAARPPRAWRVRSGGASAGCRSAVATALATPASSSNAIDRLPTNPLVPFNPPEQL